MCAQDGCIEARQSVFDRKVSHPFCVNHKPSSRASRHYARAPEATQTDTREPVGWAEQPWDGGAAPATQDSWDYYQVPADHHNPYTTGEGGSVVQAYDHTVAGSYAAGEGGGNSQAYDYAAGSPYTTGEGGGNSRAYDHAVDGADTAGGGDSHGQDHANTNEAEVSEDLARAFESHARIE